ncbi:MAG TPA: molecular chaperone TorD family protein [Thermodesulfobacteriota bacterium]|nr:molecular chaperone TorD family protein [Thermodesulfobacteriota bacterium]
MASSEVFSDNGLSAMSRGNVYLLLSRLYSGEADRDLLDWLCSQQVVSALESLGVDVARMLSCPPEGSAEGPGHLFQGLLEELAEEYTALFLLPGGVLPYESVRLKGQLCQEPEWEVRKLYNDCGLVVNEQRKIFADHIGVELGFMGFLTGKEHAGWESGSVEEAHKWRRLQSEFFNAHLGGWAFNFLDDVERVSCHGFYREAAVLTKRFLELEHKEFALPGGC